MANIGKITQVIGPVVDVSFDGEGWEDVDKSTSRYVGIPGMSAVQQVLHDRRRARWKRG